MRVTVKQIAKACGVSQPTVSLILNNKGDRYNEGTRKKVVAMAQQLGYLPNASARAIATGMPSSIGLLLSTEVRRSVVSNMVPGIQRALRDLNLHLTVAELPDEALSNSGFVPRILREYAVSGFIIGYMYKFPPKMTELIERHRIPSVWVNTKREHDAVYPDDFNCGRLATQRLLKAGHKHVAYLSYTHTEHYSHADRWEGYCAAMRSAGLPIMDLRADHDLEGAEVVAHSAMWLKRKPRPTALVTYGASDVTNALCAMLPLGLQSPRDISMVTINEEMHRPGGLFVDTMCLPFYEVGRKAVEMLMQRIKEPGTPLPSITEPFDFQTGNSVAPPLRE